MRKPTRPLARRIDERQPAPYQQSSPEPVFCNEHERCQGCPYPHHGIVCWHRGSFVINGHSAIIDGFVRLFRQEMEQAVKQEQGPSMNEMTM